MNLVETDKEGKAAAAFVAVRVVDDGGGGGGGRTQDLNGITSIQHWSDFSRA